MVLALVKASNWRVERKVKLKSLNSPPIEVMVELVKLTRPPALWEVRFPLTCCGPSMAMVPLAVLPMTMLPETVEQSESWLASAWELTVTVGWEQMVEVWAAATLKTARAGRSFWANILMLLCCYNNFFWEVARVC